MECNKENCSYSSSASKLSAEQKWRIDQNFRAAKAILTRKRPREDIMKPRPPPTWPSVPFNDRKHDGKPRESHAYTTNNYDGGFENVGKLDNIDASRHSHELGTSAKLQWPFKEALLDDFDLDNDILEQLDTLCKPRTPLAQLSANKPLASHPLAASDQPTLICQSRATKVQDLQSEFSLFNTPKSMPSESCQAESCVSLEVNDIKSKDDKLSVTKCRVSKEKSELLPLNGGHLNMPSNHTPHSTSSLYTAISTPNSVSSQESCLGVPQGLSVPTTELTSAYVWTLNNALTEDDNLPISKHSVIKERTALLFLNGEHSNTPSNHAPHSFYAAVSTLQSLSAMPACGHRLTDSLWEDDKLFVSKQVVSKEKVDSLLLDGGHLNMLSNHFAHSTASICAAASTPKSLPAMRACPQTSNNPHSTASPYDAVSTPKSLPAVCACLQTLDGPHQEDDKLSVSKQSNSNEEVDSLLLDGGPSDTSSNHFPHSTASLYSALSTPKSLSSQKWSLDMVPGQSVCATELMPAYLRKLNDSQKEAVLSDAHKPLLILAGPGSGKTSTMVARLLRLLNEGVHARSIIAMTFTTAAASEMKDRVGAHVGKAVSKELNVCTFHSFCLQLCRAHAEMLGRSSEFLVYGRGQQRKAVVEATRLALAELGPSKEPVVTSNNSVRNNLAMAVDQLSEEHMNPRLWKERAKKWDKFITQAKASGVKPDFYEKLGNIFGAAVLRHYNATLAACDALDYHDLICCAVSLLKTNHKVFEEYQTAWPCILVDEFQDTSAMQYELLRLLASHQCVTVVGDDDQSIFSFNGADSSNFNSFRKDFPDLKEVRLHHNYRSTRCIVEAASCLIGNNLKRCENKQALTDNDFGDKITVKECRNSDAQCCFVIDAIIAKAQINSNKKPSYGDFAILYRRQVTGKVFQSALRARKIPFNVHGVAFYRKKVIKTVVAMLWTALHEGQTVYCNRAFKALYATDKSESKKVVEYVDKVAKASDCDFLEAARRIFTAKVSGRFSRPQLANGRKVLTLIDAVHRLCRKEQSLSSLITAVVNLVPQKSAFQKRAIVDADEGKFLNEDDDPRTVLEYLLDDVADFLCNHFSFTEGFTASQEISGLEGGCLRQLKSFLDYMTSREMGNFRARREDNKNSVTLTTMHQSKGLEWDIVFIVKANETEVPLLHETMGIAGERATSLEEERRLFYVAMTRARKKLYVLYVTWDNNQQLLHPTRFLRELPQHLLDTQVDNNTIAPLKKPDSIDCLDIKHVGHEGDSPVKDDDDVAACVLYNEKADTCQSINDYELLNSTEFLKGFNVEARSTIAALFHNWAKKPAFQDPKRLLDKISFVLDERMRSKNAKNKDTLRAVKCCLSSEDAFVYAQHVLKWVKIPPEERALLLSEKQEYFQQKSAERSMGSSAATAKQISYLRSLGCTSNPTSRLHASRLIEQYKAL